MSILIKGMEMPQAGDMIICGQINGKLQCTIVTRGKSTKWCEASEVSAPHGRLIDADAFLEENKEFANRDFIHPKYECTLRDLIDSAPTIIEAEASE